LFCTFVCRSVARNVTVDSERPTSSFMSSPMKVANGSVSSASQSRPYSRPKERPRSVGSQLEPVKAGGVERTSSIRLEDISSPRLQSSTNHIVTASGSRVDDADASARSTKLQPTRAAPSPPVEEHAGVHKPPQRPPPPCPATSTATSNHYDEIGTNSPTGPPPAPPDSRHRFYSSQRPRRPAPAATVADRTDASCATSVSSMRCKFEPVRCTSAAVAQRHVQVQRDSKNGATVPATPATSLTRPQQATARPSPALSESQC